VLGLFVLISHTATTVYTSADGITWGTTAGAPTNSYMGRYIDNGSIAIGVANSTLSSRGICSSTDGQTWTLRESLSGLTGDVSWDGNKFVACGNGVIIYTSSDGVTWTSVTPFSTLTPQYRGINSIDGTLFVAGNSTGPSRALVIKSTDGVNWEIDYWPTASVAIRGTVLEKSQGQLFMGTQEGFGATPKLHARSLSANEYQIGNYQLIPFRSPPKKRHRYIFNWDRKADVNNIDDAAIVGIGFIPRYLALRGHG